MWTPLSIQPPETGRYIVAHRGTAKIIHYLHPDGNWLPTAKLGWQDDPAKFGATHYQRLEEVTMEDMRDAEEHRLELLADRDVIEGEITDLENKIVDIDGILATCRNGFQKTTEVSE